jgi:hypothetical protein
MRKALLQRQPGYGAVAIATVTTAEEGSVMIVLAGTGIVTGQKTGSLSVLIMMVAYALVCPLSFNKYNIHNFVLG